MLRRFLRGGLCVLLLAACSDATGADTSTSAAITVPVATTTATTATTIAPTTTLPPTTTTTIPSLDRSDAATVARMRADLEALLANGPRVPGSDAETAAVSHFSAAAETITGVVATIVEVPLPTGATSHNALVEIGSGERALLLAAHIDSVPGTPGADDNGSGVVLLLELLRRLQEAPPDGLRVLLVAFGAEERVGDYGHHFGSRHAVAEMEAAGALPDFMVSVDMVGIGEELQVVDHRDSDSAFADELALVAGEAGIGVVRNSRGEVSDHVPFARAGVPAAMLNRPDNPAWHTPQDDSVHDAMLLATLRVIAVLIDHLTPQAYALEGSDNHPL